jgi:hypothetical protein
MRLSTLLAVVFTSLFTVSCFAQRQLAYPINPELGGFPPGHPGIPAVVDVPTGKPATWNADDLKLGDSLLLELSGKAASSYLKLFGHQVPDELFGPFGVPLEARIVALDGKRIVAEFQTTLSRDSDPPRIVTVASSILRSEISSPPHLYPPRDGNGTETNRQVREMQVRHASMPRIRRNSLDQVTIRVWELVEEISG